MIDQFAYVLAQAENRKLRRLFDPTAPAEPVRARRALRLRGLRRPRGLATTAPAQQPAPSAGR
ncbi:MAG TPA: hypothetical protein VM204_09115 [Gaiellaceae bacterium]|nr:hypothetical protein [Gaiellaceae bacterium]